MNAAYIIAVICLGLAAGSLYTASKLGKDTHGDTPTVGVVLIMCTVGFLFGAALFAMIGIDIQYPGIMS